MSYKAVRETSGVAALYRHSHCNKYAVSNCFPVTTVIRRPNWEVKFIAASRHGPRLCVSTTTGTKWYSREACRNTSLSC